MFFKKIEEFRKVVRDIPVDDIIVGDGRFRVRFEGEAMAALARRDLSKMAGAPRWT